MQLKVNLPNPNELTAEQFFAQMRIAIKAAEKTYQEAIKGLTEEEIKNDFWIYYEFVDFNKEELKQIDNIDPDSEKRLNIAISINRL